MFLNRIWVSFCACGRYKSSMEACFMCGEVKIAAEVVDLHWRGLWVRGVFFLKTCIVGCEK